ncbi:3-dehydroquinate synthase [Agrococcus carbonis]|uniref:3-dehydroquinate synthase n=1 Tax=Agrococcus carbonis TaxID=684552 RepID=A0A1H1KY46_9MICO|nr:3-dehydroquinate synthase [Agrococcus carbonis]SDR67057.1 3-dehydroquinate synthase [Agrococcus carbonis]
MTTIRVETEAPYDVHVGRGILVERLRESLGDAQRLLVVHQPAMSRIADHLKDELGIEVLLAEVPDAEAAKRIEVAQFLWQIMGQAEFTRTDAVLGLGGGAVTDLAGFAAATWLRGIRVLQAPTSVLGIVDAAVGGKTGINTEQGKNLVGAFHHPSLVVADLELVDSLPRNELLTGFAEIAKAGFIADPRILELLEGSLDAATDPTTPEFQEVVARSIEVKARVVANDFREAGEREFLNYGHTLGHAIEHTERYRWRHGAAVSIGMVFAAELSRLAGRLPESVVDRHRAVLSSLELPMTYPVGRWQTLLGTMRKDKKARGSMLRFVVLDDVAKPRILEGPDEGLLFMAYQSLAD